MLLGMPHAEKFINAMGSSYHDLVSGYDSE